METIRRSFIGGPSREASGLGGVTLDRMLGSTSSFHAANVELTAMEASRDMDNELMGNSSYVESDDLASNELDPILLRRKPASASSDDEDDTDSHGLSASPGSSSNTQVATNIVVSFVGAGLLGVPNAFAQAGWLLGSVTLCAVSALNVYAMLLLPQVQKAVQAKQLLQQQPYQQPCQSYGDLGRCILGPRGETLVNVSLGISQAGFATAYIIFISANLKATWGLPRGPVCFACVPGLAALVQFRDVKSLSPFSFLANLSNFCALSAVLVQDYASYSLRSDAMQPVKWSGFLYVIAITVYSMEGIGLILSLEGSAKDRAGFNGLFKWMLTGITLFMAFFGSAGCLAFGEDTKAPITLNLGKDWTATFVKCALCLGLYLT